MRSLLLLFVASLLIGLSACDSDPFTLSPEELAEQIRRNTPTELPPITTVGANTRGAWIHPQPGSPLWEQAGRVDSFLFVASGVDRPETALAESLDCEAFDNFLVQSLNVIGISGRYCRRPEIGDDRRIWIGIENYLTQDSVQIFFVYSHASSETGSGYRLPRSTTFGEFNLLISEHFQLNNQISGVFNAKLINRSQPYDTLHITQGRFDVTYGITP